MEIIFPGKQSTEDAIKILSETMLFFRKKFNIENFREMRLSFIMQDGQGVDVELIDNKTHKIYNLFEASSLKKEKNKRLVSAKNYHHIRLVVNNTK
jgi:hypothetical protein